MNFISHPSETIGEDTYPEKLLKDHLLKVGLNAFSYINELYLTDSEKISKYAFIAGACHDFGKYTTYFQHYLINKGTPKNERTSHALISSVFGAYSVLKLLGESETKMAIIVFMAISHHHGNLTSPSRFFGKHCINSSEEIWWDGKVKDRVANLRIQLKDIEKNSKQIEGEISSIFAKSDIKWNIDYPSIEDFLHDGWIYTVNKIIRTTNNLTGSFIKEGNELETYFHLLLLFSSLLDSDKRDAGRIPNSFKRLEISASIVESRVTELGSNSGKNTLQKLRNDLFQQTSKMVNNLDLEHHILTLTAPTGSGKTLSAIHAAIRLRERFVQSIGKSFRIIYCLPYTSIIDQNYTVIKSLLERIDDFHLTPARYLLKHHHLSDIDTKETDEGVPIEMALALTEAWDSEIIVTTFVQLFQSLIGNRNKFLRKVHRISNSIIILDEIQSINIEFWAVISETIKQAARFLNCYFIFLTATQPLIIGPDEKVEIGLGTRPLELNRTFISFLKEKKTEDDVDNAILLSAEKRTSVLVIRNTIKLSINMFNRLQEKLDTDHLKIKLFYLSANILPRDRTKRINEIENSLKKKEKMIVVSTQVVEAGIDLDFGAVFRDLGPMDSIIQATGRCNRNNTAESPMEVGIINLLDDNSNVINYSKSGAIVYGSVHMDVAYEIISHNEMIYEEQYHIILEEYYKKISERRCLDKSATDHKLFQNMAKLHFDISDKADVKSFSIIDKKRPTINLFIAKDDECIQLLNWYKDKILKNKDSKERKIEFLKKRSDFNSCMISIDEKRARESGATPLTGDESIYVLESVICKAAYDDKIGLKKLDDALIAL